MLIGSGFVVSYSEDVRSVFAALLVQGLSIDDCQLPHRCKRRTITISRRVIRVRRTGVTIACRLM